MLVTSWASNLSLLLVRMLLFLLLWTCWALHGLDGFLGVWKLSAGYDLKGSWKAFCLHRTSFCLCLITRILILEIHFFNTVTASLEVFAILFPLGSLKIISALPLPSDFCLTLSDEIMNGFYVFPTVSSVSSSVSLEHERHAMNISCWLNHFVNLNVNSSDHL